MSPKSYELFNIWFPALAGALLIGLLVAALWEFVRRKFWLFVHRFRPSILEEVGLDSRHQSRAEAEDHHKEIIEKMNIFARVVNLLVSPKSSNCGATTAFDIEAQTEIHPHHATPVIRMTGTSAVQGTYSISRSFENHLYPGETIQGIDCRPINIIFTSYFPDGTSKDVTRPAKRLYRRHASGPVKRMKSSIILQASIVMDPWVLAEIVELAKHCMQKENKCVFQLGNWAILYYSVGEVQLHLLKEGDVPVNIESRWQDGKVGIMMRGLYLMGSQIKVGTKHTNKILQSASLATQGVGDLDELYLLHKEFGILRENSLIYASKVVVVDGVSFIVRSEASCILPPQEAIWTRWLWISNYTKMLQSLLFGVENCQSKHTTNRPKLEFDPKQLELRVEHWKGLSEIELLNSRKEVLFYLLQQGKSGIVENDGPLSPHSHLIFIQDEHYLEYWQEGLRVLNEVINQNSSDSHSHTHIRVRGGIQFLLGDFQSALQDYDLAHLNIGGHQSTVLFDRALVKCMLGRYSEAMQDVVAVIKLNPNINDTHELQACIQQILHQQRASRIVTQSRPSYQRSLLPDPDNFGVKIPDLLTGDEWQPGEIRSLRPISDSGTAGESTVVSRTADWSTTSIAEALKLQLKLTNYAQSLEMNPRYHVRRISFMITLLEDECDPDDVVKPLSPENLDLLNWQAPTEDLQNDLQVRETLISLSRRLLPGKNISHTFYSNVTADDGHEQRRGSLPLSGYRYVSCRSAMLTKHSAADRDVQTLFLYDGAAGDPSCWRRRSYEYIKLFVLPEARSPYRAFWLVQWDVVDMWQVSGDGQGDPDRMLYSIPAAVEGKDVNKKQFYSIRLSENRYSPWIAEVAGADGNGQDRHRGSDSRINSRLSIPANYEPQTSRQSSSDVEEVRARDTGSKGDRLKIAARRRLAFKNLTIEIRPPKFKRKLWFGTYEPEDVDRAKDAINYYIGSGHPYHFSDSPSIFAQHKLSDEYRELHPSCDLPYQFSDSPWIFATERGDPDWGFCSNPAAVERQDGLKEFHSVRSRWIAEVAAAGTSSPTSEGNGLNRHHDARTNPRMSIPANYRPQTSRQIVPRSGREPGASQHYGVLFRPDLQKWVTEIRVPEWKAVYLARKLLKCQKKHQPNLPYSTTIPPHLILMHLTKARANPRMSLPVNEKPQTWRPTQPLRASGVNKVFPTISEIFDFGGDSPVDSSSMNAYERKSVDNFHHHNGDEEAMSEVLRSADANTGLSKETDLAAFCGEEESTFGYQCRGLQLEHTTPRDEKARTLKEWNQNQKDDSRELKIENGLQVAAKRGTYHNLSRSTCEQLWVSRASGDNASHYVQTLAHQIFRKKHLSNQLMKHDLRSIIDARLEGLPDGSTPFALPVAVDIMLQIAKAMWHLNDLDVVHRDLKAQNVLLKPLPLAESGSAFRPEHYYSVELVFFGVTESRTQSSDGKTRMAGTSLYKAPEMLEVRELPLKADVWSFGILCHEILSRKQPIEGSRNQGLSLPASRPLHNLIRRDSPEAVTKLIHQCLDSNPAMRPAFDHIVMKLRAVAGRDVVA